MKKNIVLLAVVIALVNSACQNTETPSEQKEEHTDLIPSIETFEEREILFDKTQFDDPTSVDLLKEINICSDARTDNHGKINTPCSPELFQLFPLRSTTPLKDGFILLIRANTSGFGLRRVLVFERENGILVKVNGFVANLIGTKPRNNANDDLLLRFIDKIDGSDVFYHCIFRWEDGRYVFKTIEAIHEPSGNFYGKIKADIKDSLSLEIHNILVDHQMIF